MTHTLLRRWLIDILRRRQRVVALAARQRAKFEHWLKFELAAHAEERGATEVRVEPSTANLDRTGRADVSVTWRGSRSDVELKTPNGNWRIPGVEPRTRPITQNIASVISDARKLAECSGEGLVAFVLFPVPPGDTRWHRYLERISRQVGIRLTPTRHTTRITLPVSDSDAVDFVVVSFPVSGSVHVGRRRRH